MFNAPRLLALVPFTLAAAFAVTGVQAAAPAQCKTLSKKACGATPACAWVDGYVRKDGRKVSAYCRKAPGRKAKPSVRKAKPSVRKAKPSVRKKPAPLAKALKKQG